VAPGLAERLLIALSRDPRDGDVGSAASEWDDRTADRVLVRDFPDFAAGRRVADHGCGEGYQSLALARKYDCRVLGIDTNETLLARAARLASDAGFSRPCVTFAPKVNGSMRGVCDVVISQNSFEHYGDPARVLAEMKSMLRPGGRILMTFGPLWFSPRGSHMGFFCRVPWLNLLFSEKTVMKVRARYRDDGALRYEDVESGLNRMTVRRFEKLVEAAGLRFERRRYRCVKGLPLGRLPWVRELVVNKISAVLVSRD